MFPGGYLRKLFQLLSPADLADEHGLVAVGGDLSPRTLLQAYQRGIFPWFSEGDPIFWWSPNPRAIFELDGLHVARRLQRTIRSGKFTLSVNRDFARVIRGCADRAEGTWITAEMIAAYERMHRLGHAHSVEVWHAGQLAGGLYGVALGGFFAGESMFTRIRDASKVALVGLVERLRQRGFQLFDTQFVTEHTTGMGAKEIPRAEYLKRLKRALKVETSFA
ncbi:MAG: leucyl/phenylalanyl-tRNA--protein transferase [Planctomycetia bacterium]|nr:leucyl/phenylalanyl-tRNA--protein transferase [Planctomycetia bacterium]